MSADHDRIDDFDFQLPEELIALRPAEPRSSARMLVVNGRNGQLADRTIADFSDYITAGDVLVLNTTRVIQAALRGRRAARDEGGRDIELTINLNRRVAADTWSAFLRPAKRVRTGDAINLSSGLNATVISDPDAGECELRFNQSGKELEAAIEAHGSTPLPPYILSRRPADQRDRTDYQTSFADQGESVAAPTAGLHLTGDMLASLTKAGAIPVNTRLDVNAGTFRPVMTDRLSEHRMHAERAHLSQPAADQINAARAAGGRSIAVGTTSMRTLESASGNGVLAPYDADTDIFIRPGHQFRACDGLLTNFHLPRSTLFVLVCAFMGVDLMKAAYQHAIDKHYRFFSYGDACLLLPNG